MSSSELSNYIVVDFHGMVQDSKDFPQSTGESIKSIVYNSKIVFPDSTDLKVELIYDTKAILVKHSSETKNSIATIINN